MRSIVFHNFKAFISVERGFKTASMPKFSARAQSSFTNSQSAYNLVPVDKTSTEIEAKGNRSSLNKLISQSWKKTNGSGTTSSSSDLSEVLPFFEACQRPQVVANESNVREMTSLYPDRIVELQNSDVHLNMYLLPANISEWPSFYSSKQEEATNRNLFFHRVSQTHSLRFNATVDLLRAGKKVVATGVAGIGKSTELNAYLMVFLANVGKEGWPSEIWYRFDKKLLKFSLCDNIPCVDEVEFVTLDTLEIMTGKYRKYSIGTRPVLFLELTESEVNPLSYIPTLVQPSNRDVYGMTKEFHKAGARYMLINPPTCDELCQMACWEAEFGADSMFKGMDRADIVKLVTERVNIVGPIPRSVFQTSDEFKSTVVDLDKNIAELFDVVGRVSESNLPHHAKYYLAPFVDDETVVPYLTKGDPVPTSLRCLSPYISLIIAKACTTRERRSILEQRRFGFLIMEDIIKYGLLQHADRKVRNDDWLVSNWDFYRNPPDRNVLNYATDHIDFNATGITTCRREAFFDAKYLTRPVQDLESETLYSSSKHNGALYDCIYVDKKQKTVFVFQVSSQAADKHSLSIYTVRDVMTKLQLFKAEGFRMKYFYCCTSQKKSQSACRLDLSKGSRMQEMDPDELQSTLSRLDIFIARIMFFPDDEDFLN